MEQKALKMCSQASAQHVSQLTCPTQVALNHVKPFLDPCLHVIQVVQHGAQGAVHALQLIHQVTVVLWGLVLVLQELQHAVVWLATEGWQNSRYRCMYILRILKCLYFKYQFFDRCPQFGVWHLQGLWRSPCGCPAPPNLELADAHSRSLTKEKRREERNSYFTMLASSQMTTSYHVVCPLFFLILKSKFLFNDLA